MSYVPNTSLYTNVKNFGAVGDNVTNDSAPSQAAIDAVADHFTATGFRGVVYFPEGSYKLLTRLVLKSGVTLMGPGRLNGSAVAIDSDGRYRVIYAKGTIGSSVLLTLDARRGEMQVTVASTAGLAVGDQVRLRNATARGTLASTITDTATSIVVNVPAGCGTWPTRGFAICGSERIAYDGAAVAGSQVTLTVRAGALGRGAQGTTKVSHTPGTSIFPFHSGIWHLGSNSCYERAETQTIDRIVGSTLIFGDALTNDYPVAQAAQILKRTPVTQAAIRDLEVEMTQTVDDAVKEEPIWLDEVDDFEIKNVQANYGSMNAVALRHATRGDIENVRSQGKATHNPSGALDFYGGVTLIDGCQDITIDGVEARQGFKGLTTYSSGQSGSSISAFAGVPSFITAEGLVFDNGGLGYHSRHAAFEIHRAGRHITIDGFEAHGADSLISIQSADNIRILNGGGTGFYRAGVLGSELHEVRGLQVANINVGERTFGAGRTITTADPGVGGTSISVVDASVIIDDAVSTDVGQLVEITDSDGFSNREVIRVRASSDGVTLQNCTRAQDNTTAVAHAIGSIVRAYGSPFYSPLDIDFSDCIFKQRTYDQPVIALTADPGTGGTSLATGNTSAQRWPAVPFQALIEGENSATNFCPEIVTVTAMTSTTMTVTRGQESTDAVAHTTGIFVMPYEPAVMQNDIDNVQGKQDLVYYGAVLRGYVPTQQTRVRDIQVSYNGPVRHNGNAGIAVFPHGVRLRGVSTQNFPYAAIAYGNGQVWRDFDGQMPAQETLGGQGIYVAGADIKIIALHVSKVYQAIAIATTNLRTTIVDPVMDVPFSSRGITGWDATTRVVGKPTFILQSGQDLAVTAAATLAPGCPGDLYWRVSGTTGIGAITAMADGTEITLEFASGTTVVTPGASLKVNGAAAINFTGDDVAKFVCRNSVWRQSTAQSVN